ncbi:MAG: transaldolase [Chloroflexi bacterium]|jgi:transaldolase|uniref:Transaldolase n=1 Tax=Candidatus Thermofonsia Clade 3 bacterium TaxID=2364212 RepID=A0A2M8Q9W2_9CHLR|nr:transaldolase family protein [Candidatus Roseilinea sp. NK_OTU-006]PJF46599.1 MAG: transaldolase [Candidatus Thermofonsia Clade 3 bacterium]RMG66195.1 MAG: transaldolase [Chloroflexota bacterium]
MKFFLDSAIVDEIAYALDLWDIDGVTTNPRHILASGKPMLQVIREIGKLVEGTTKTVSVEVNPHYRTVDEFVCEGRKLASLHPNFVIKLHCIEPAFKAIPILAKDGIRVNVTLIFNAVQALAAMRAGAYYVSPFIGWKEANAEETRDLIADIVQIRDNYGFKTEVLVAAVRNGRQIADAAVAGADIVTAALSVYKDAFDHPYTRDGLAKFQEFWDQGQYA